MGPVKGERWFKGLPDQHERYRNVVLRDEEPPEGLRQLQGVGHVFKHHLVFLAAVDGAVGDKAAERTVVRLAAIRQVLIGPSEVVRSTSGIHHEEPPAHVHQ